MHKAHMVRHPGNPAPVDRQWLVACDSGVLSKLSQWHAGLGSDCLVAERALGNRRDTGVRLSCHSSVAERAVQAKRLKRHQVLVEARIARGVHQLACAGVDRVWEINGLLKRLVKTQDRDGLAKPTCDNESGQGGEHSNNAEAAKSKNRDQNL